MRTKFLVALALTTTAWLLGCGGDEQTAVPSPPQAAQPAAGPDDADVKSMLRNVQIWQETFFTDASRYAPTLAALERFSGETFTGAAVAGYGTRGYTLEAAAISGVRYRVVKRGSTSTRTCAPATGACAGGRW